MGCPFIYKDVDYKAFISSKGYFVGGKLLRSEINDEFLKYYDDVRNEYLKSRIKESYTWIGQLILNPQCVLNPFQHILFKRFSDSLSPRFVFKKAHPFGEGPWLCFNKVCEHYMTASINELKIEYGRNRKLVGVFTCTCGMTYTRVYSLKENKEKFEIRNRGGLWMSTFDLYYKQGMTPKEIARNLGTNASVITMHIKRKSLDFVVQRKRRQWKKISRGLGYTQARINEPSLYKWLFRNDRDWLLSTKLNKKNENLAQLRLNWEVIDESLSEEITIAIEEIVKTDGRVSKTLIAKIVTYGRYIHCGDLKKLPKTKALLEQKTESTEDYHLRKIDSIAKGISSEGASISKWKVLKRAGIKRPSTIELEKLNLLLKNNH
ncbi:MAG TPA: TnsD family Tn7-like transposition protein [Cyclobacteriaceae bacterium]|nr:TnsD family Tn7-like transposition protein [Cyclobacteriaceae bacterium]